MNCEMFLLSQSLEKFVFNYYCLFIKYLLEFFLKLTELGILFFPWEDFEIQNQLLKYVLEYSSYKSFLKDFWKFSFFKDFFHVIYFVTFMAIVFSDYLFNVCKVYNDLLFHFPILVIFDFFFFWRGFCLSERRIILVFPKVL